MPINDQRHRLTPDHEPPTPMVDVPGMPLVTAASSRLNQLALSRRRPLQL
jgi:hypothetical protein